MRWQTSPYHVVCLSHLYALLKQFDGFTCHLAGTLVWFSDASFKLIDATAIFCCPLVNVNDELYRLLPNCIGLVMY